MDDNNNLDDDYLTSLLGDDFFGMNEINLYYIDDKDNYDLGNINEKAYSVNNYKDLTESIGEDKGIVKMTLSKDAKVCNISEEITEELINQKKEEGYDIIAYEKNGQYEYIILNEKAIDKKQFLSKEEALKDYALEEEKYQNLIKALLGEEESQKQEQEAKKRKNNPEPVITEEMKQAREELTKQMQMLGLLDIDESVEYSQLNDAYNAVSQAKIDINYGFLRMVIELLSGMDVAPLEISNAVIEFDILKDLELDCDISFIENYKEDIKELYSVSSSGGAGGLIKSYAQRLKELRSSLQELSPDYSYYETANYLTYMGEFAADLNWTDKELEQKAKEIGDEETQRLRDQLKVKAGKFNDIEIDEIILDDDRKQTKEVREQIDLITSLVNSNQNLSTTVAYKIASDIELSEAELGFYENRKDQKEFIELVDVYSEAIFAEASYNVIFGEATEKDWEIYNDKEKQAKYADIYKRDISIRFMNDLSVPEKDRGERQKAFLARHESNILNWGSGTWQKYDLDNQHNNDGIISSDVIDILDNRENSLKSKLSELNINSIFDNTSSKTSVYDKMSDTELYIINAYTTLMINKTVERMQPVLEREDKRKRLNAYKDIREKFANNMCGEYYDGTVIDLDGNIITDENGKPLQGYGSSFSDERKEYLFNKYGFDGSWDSYWCESYYSDKAYHINTKVLLAEDLYDKPNLTEYHNLLAEEVLLNYSKESDQEELEQCKNDYAKFKEAFYDSKATLIKRYPSEDPKQRAIEEDFLLERDQYKISLETEKLGEKVLQNNKELEKIKDDWEYTFDNLEKDLKKYAKKLGYDKNNLTAADLEVILEKYLNDSDVKSIKTSKKTSMDNTFENRELILSTYKQRNALNKEQLTLSDTIASLQNVNLSLYTLYSDYDENQKIRIDSIKVEKCPYWGERLVYAYDENGNRIDATAADLALFCSESKENSDLIDGAFNGPKLYIVDSKGVAKSVGNSSDIMDIVTGINYIPNKEEYYDLVSYLTSIDAKNGTNYASSAAAQISDIGKRIEGARLAKERQEKIDKAARVIGNIFTLGNSGIIDGIFDIDSSYYIGQGIATVGVGLGDGLAQFKNGLYYIFGGADGKVSAEDYARMYFAQGLEDNFGGCFKGIYEISTSIGNMLPTIVIAAIGTAITYFSGGSAAPAVAKVLATLCSITSKALMGLSAAGNAAQQGMQEGMSLTQALVYGGLVGTSEVLLEKLLGGIPYLSDTPNLLAKLLSKVGGEPMQKFLANGVVKLVHEMASEALEEGLQEILDPVFKVAVGREWEGVDWEAVGKSALYGALTAGIMQGSGKLASAGLSVALTGNSNGLKVALNQMLSQQKQNIFDNFDILKNNIETLRKNGKSSEVIKASLKVDANIKTKYEQYVDLFLNNQNAFGDMDLMSFDQYVEYLTLNSIIGINGSEGNINTLNTKIESLNNKINDINAKLENETDVLKINELVKQRENINKQIEECNTQIKHYEFFKQFNGNYQNAALLYANNMFSSMIETILEENGVVEGIDKIKSSEIESLFAQLETSYKIDQSKYSEIVNGLKSTDTVGFQEQMSNFLRKDLTMSDIIEIQNILQTFGVDQSLIKNLFVTKTSSYQDTNLGIYINESGEIIRLSAIEDTTTLVNEVNNMLNIKNITAGEVVAALGGLNIDQINSLIENSSQLTQTSMGIFVSQAMNIYQKGLEVASEKYKAFFENFRDHGFKHALEVTKYALSKTNGANLSSTQTAILAFAALAHDFGMRGGEVVFDTKTCKSMAKNCSPDVIEAFARKMFSGTELAEFLDGFSKIDQSKPAAIQKYLENKISGKAMNLDVLQDILTKTDGGVKLMSEFEFVSSFVRSQHPLNSALDIIENADIIPTEIQEYLENLLDSHKTELSEKGINIESTEKLAANVLAILAMTHSKSTSGISMFNVVSQWQDCINKLDVAAKERGIDINKSALEAMINNEAIFNELVNYATWIRDGDAMSIVVSADGTIQTITQDGGIGHLNDSRARLTADNMPNLLKVKVDGQEFGVNKDANGNYYYTDADGKIQIIEDTTQIYALKYDDACLFLTETVTYDDGRPSRIVDNSYSVGIHASELYVNHGSEYTYDSNGNPVKYEATATVRISDAMPTLTFHDIAERLGEVNTYTNIPDRSFVIKLPAGTDSVTARIYAEQLVSWVNEAKTTFIDSLGEMLKSGKITQDQYNSIYESQMKFYDSVCVVSYNESNAGSVVLSADIMNKINAAPDIPAKIKILTDSVPASIKGSTILGVENAKLLFGESTTNAMVEMDQLFRVQDKSGKFGIQNLSLESITKLVENPLFMSEVSDAVDALNDYKSTLSGIDQSASDFNKILEDNPDIKAKLDEIVALTGTEDYQLAAKTTSIAEMEFLLNVLKKLSNDTSLTDSQKQLVEELYIRQNTIMRLRTDVENTYNTYSCDRYNILADIDTISNEIHNKLELFMQEYGDSDVVIPSVEEIKTLLKQPKGLKETLNIMSETYKQTIRKVYEAHQHMKFGDLVFDVGDQLGIKFNGRKAANDGSVAGFITGGDKFFGALLQKVSESGLVISDDIVNFEKALNEIFAHDKNIPSELPADKKTAIMNKLNIDEAKFDSLWSEYNGVVKTLKEKVATDLISADANYLYDCVVNVFKSTDGKLSFDYVTGNEFNAWINQWQPGMLTKAGFPEMLTKFAEDLWQGNNYTINQSSGTYETMSFLEFIQALQSQYNNSDMVSELSNPNSTTNTDSVEEIPFTQQETSYKLDQNKYSEIVNGLKSTDTIGFQAQMSKFIGKDLTMSDIIEIQNILQTFGVETSTLNDILIGENSETNFMLDPSTLNDITDSLGIDIYEELINKYSGKKLTMTEVVELLDILNNIIHNENNGKSITLNEQLLNKLFVRELNGMNLQLFANKSSPSPSSLSRPKGFGSTNGGKSKSSLFSVPKGFDSTNSVSNASTSQNNVSNTSTSQNNIINPVTETTESTRLERLVNDMSDSKVGQLFKKLLTGNKEFETKRNLGFLNRYIESIRGVVKEYLNNTSKSSSTNERHSFLSGTNTLLQFIHQYKHQFGMYSNSSEYGPNFDVERYAKSTFDDGFNGMEITSKSLRTQFGDYRITFKSDVELTTDEAIAFVNTLIEEANREGLALRAKNAAVGSGESDFLILYLDEENLGKTVDLLERLKDGQKYGELVSNATKHFMASQPFTATVGENPYYGVSMANAGRNSASTISFSNRPISTFNQWIDILVERAYSSLIDSGLTPDTITANSLYNEMLKLHSGYMGSSNSEIPLWMNASNYNETINQLESEHINSATNTDSTFIDNVIYNYNSLSSENRIEALKNPQVLIELLQNNVNLGINQSELATIIYHHRDNTDFNNMIDLIAKNKLLNIDGANALVSMANYYHSDIIQNINNEQFIYDMFNTLINDSSNNINALYFMRSLSKEQSSKLFSRLNGSWFQYDNILNAFRNVDNTMYGADQDVNMLQRGLFGKYYLTDSTYAESYNQIVEYAETKYNMPKKVVDRLLGNVINKQLGACSYASLCNSIFVQYINDPVGFKNTFGFDMYETINGNQVLNYRQLLFDMFVKSNIEGEGFRINETSSKILIRDKNGRLVFNKVKDGSGTRLADSREQINMFWHAASRYYFESYGLEQSRFNLSKDLLSQLNLNTETHKRFLKEQLVYLMSSGYSLELLEIQIKENPINFICVDDSSLSLSTNNWDEGDSHVTTIVDVDNDGVYVISWGHKYYVKFEDLKFGNYGIDAIKLK